ncbi:hypothetical protein ACFE04_021744 [Oxalis oulophora]
MSASIALPGGGKNLVLTWDASILVERRKSGYDSSKWLRGVDGGVVSTWSGNSGFLTTSSIQNMIAHNASSSYQNGPADCVMDHALEEDPIGLIEAKKRLRLPSISGTSQNSDMDYLNARMAYQFGLEKKHIKWRQQAKIHWMQYGDINSKFFHHHASARKRNNTIHGLFAGDGSWTTEAGEIQDITFQYFSTLFARGSVNGKTGKDSIAKETSDQEHVLKKKVTHVHQHAFIRERFLGFGKNSILIGWAQSFLKQFYGTVTKSDYLTLRLGFIMTHCKSNPKLNFHKYMIRALEDDFKHVVVGISGYSWSSSCC